MATRIVQGGPGAAGAPAVDAELIEEARRIFDLQRERRRGAEPPSAEERIARLKRFRDAVAAHREELAAAMRADFHKHPTETELTEVQQTLGEIRHAIRHVRRWMRPKRVGTPALLVGTRSEIRYEPRGTVLILGAWNYPVLLTMTPLVAAVAAGNTVVVRPSEKTPAVNVVLGRIVADVFPEHEVALVGGGVEVADALLRLPFDHFFFTGSTAVGRKVMHAAAEHMASVTLELGGKSPAIVDASASVERAAERIAWGKFINGGQTCVAPDYVLVHESREAELLEALRRSVEAFYGDTAEARRRSESFSRMIDDGAFARVAALLEESVAAGARVEVGGETDAAARYVAPTVLSRVTWEMPVMEEEIFGPVLPVLTFRSLDDVLERINARPRPLALYVFARDSAAADRVLRRTTAGGSVVNDVVIHLANPDLPFGGVGESGQGSYHGWSGFRTFSHERAVLVRGRFSPAHLLHPPYTDRVRRLAALVGRVVG
ncbi:MAG TPA: aldehyde dehydrogenase family protein [Longimicrobiaceae bacterium]|nr:aldehyde dehydrogenase family protein [Longimicrobiaceae bacterium]